MFDDVSSSAQHFCPKTGWEKRCRQGNGEQQCMMKLRDINISASKSNNVCLYRKNKSDNVPRKKSSFHL